MQHNNSYGFIALAILIFYSTFSYSQDYLGYQYTSDKTFDEIVEIANDYFEIVGTGKGVGYKQFKRWEYWNKRNLDENGRVITNFHALKEINKFQNENPNQRAIGTTFTEMGPSSAINTSTWSSHIGRITSIGLDPNDDDHIIVGSSSGGVWRTDDFAGTWTPLSDAETYLDVFALEISHSNADHYFVGTNGGGVLKSTDAGATWNSTNGITTNDVINTLVMHPTDENILFAIGRWQGKVYKSVDGGDNWTTELDISGQLYDLEFKPGDPEIVYASGKGTVRKSTDGGDSFSTLTGPWTSTGVIMMAVTPDDEDYLYLLQEDSGGFGGVYLSTDEGANFATQSDDSCNCNNILGYDQSNGGGQAPRDMDIIVSPTDKTEVHVAGVETWKSTNSGVDWDDTTSWLVDDNLPFIHADCDILIYHGNKIFAGTDGGIFYSDDEANSFTDLTTGLGVREFYRIGVSETEPDRVSGGSQDNGTGVVKSGIWYDFVGADGMETFINHSNEDIIYTCIQNGGLYKSTNGGNTVSSPNQPAGSGAWVTPLEQDPNDDNTLYIGESHLWKSVNGASSWTQISDITTANSGDDLIKELKIAPTNSDIIYMAYEEQIFKTENGGTDWEDISPSVGFSAVNYIAIHPDDENKVSITLSGASEKVMETTDGGDTWVDITANLPSIGAECVIYEGDANEGMYVGMNPGMYYKDNISGSSWSFVGANMPNVAVVEIEIRNDILYAATYGRGLWKNPLTTAVGNYTCADAQNISSCGNFTTLALDQGNGASQSDATHAVWYKYTPDFSGSINIFSCNSGVNTRLWIHEGSCSNLSVVASSDDDCEIGPGQAVTASEVSNLPVTQGTPIYLEWDNFGSDEAFSFEIEYILNFTCDEALSIGTGTFTTPPMTLCGGASGATKNDATNAVWYEFTSPGFGTIDVYSCDGGVDTRLWIYDGDCNNLNELASSDDDCQMGAGQNNYASEVIDLAVTSGQILYLEWDDRWSADGFDFTIEFESSCEPEFSFSNGNPLTGIQNMDADFETDGIIESDQAIVQPAIVDYDSGTSIELLDGFEVRVGAVFHAFIDGCGNLIIEDEPIIDENK